MKRLLALSASALLATTIAFAATGSAQLMTSIPQDSLTVADWYKQNVYDPNNSKIGEVMDVLVSPDGRVQALIIGVGGFLGAGEKDVAVSFDSIKETRKDNKIYLMMDTTKDALKSAPGFKYDKNKTTWVPDTASNGSRS
jgi:sporulation protein YlmC with PRC-barrel domain